MKRIFRRIVLSGLFLALAGAGTAWDSQARAEETQILPAQVIENSGKQFLFKELSWNPEDVEITIEYTGEELELPAGKLDLEYQLVGAAHGVGRLPLSLNVRVNGQLKQKIWLSALVEAYFNVVRTTRPIPRDRVIMPTDVEIVRVRSSNPMHNVLYDLKEVIGFKTVSDMEKGVTLSPYMVRRVPLVQQGDRILLVAENGALRITAPGVVKENGFKNSTVQVENLQTKKIIYGTVIDSKTVKVEF